MIKMNVKKDNMISLYSNQKVLDFINNYFDVKKGVRCSVGHKKDYKSPSYYKHFNNMTCLRTLPFLDKDNIVSLLEFNCLHSFMYIFDEKVIDGFIMPNYISQIKNSIIGINAIFEIDSPYNSNRKGKRRLDIFDHIEEMNQLIYAVDKELEKQGEDYNMLFSGNGIYIILEGYYENNWFDYAENFESLFSNMKNSGYGDKLKVHIDNNKIPWNDYMKIPFTFHEKKDRISVPLAKGEINGEWLNRVSNVNNIINNCDIVDEVISKCRWKKLW